VRARALGVGLASVLALACTSELAPRAGDAAPGDVGDAGIDATMHDGALDASTPDAGSDAGRGCPVTLPPTLTFTLAAGAFPGSGHPDVAVHVPPGYDACAPLGAIVYFHGFYNCVENAIGATDTACSPGGPVRVAHRLSEQLDAAHVNALLIAVEIAYDQASGNPGAVGTSGGLRALLDELFDDHLGAMFGRATHVSDLDRIVLASHSGGYTAVARGIDRGMLPRLDEVMLFDSLYGEIPTYEGYTVTQLPRFDPAGDALRFAMVFTDGGGTDTNSRALGGEIQRGLTTLGHPEWLLFDDTTATLDAAAFTHPLVVKHSALSHDGVVLYYFQRFVAAAGFAPL
jgi:hypothetical protein